MLTDEKFVDISGEKTSIMKEDVRNMLFDQIEITKTNYKSIKIDKNIPVLNFTIENDLIKKMIDEKIIDKNVLYNDPLESKLVSDKVSFHKEFTNSKFIPKTVFDKKQAIKSLTFPIIAKPSNGRSAEGIMAFNKPEELSSSDEKFDLFSEKKTIKREFRYFGFRNTPIELNERLKVKGSKDFLKNSKTKTDFFYKTIDFDSYSNRNKLEEIIRYCLSKVKLDFFSIDFAETDDGDLFIIEMNSRTGMGVDKMIELYQLIYKDYFKTDIDKEVDKIFKKLKNEWDVHYNKKNVNECTTVAGNLDNVQFLFKNRDRSFTPDHKIFHEKYKNTEIVYYSDQTDWIEGMNEHGVGFVFSMLDNKTHNSYSQSWSVTDDPKHSSNFKRFVDKIKNILTAKTAKDAVKFIYDSKKSGSFLVGDKNEIFEVEIFEGTKKDRKLSFSETAFYAKTNHGVLIPEAGHQPSGYSIKRASTEIRKHQAYTHLQGVQTISEIPTRMKFQAFDSNSPLNVFRTDNEEYTISQCLMDLTNLRFYFFHDTATADSIKIENEIKEPAIKIDIRKI